MTQEISIGFLNSINNFISQLPSSYKPVILLGFYTLLIAIYGIFIWKFYKFISRKNIIDLNLNRYNKAERPFMNKLTASGFFLLEYLVIMPILVFFWFSILAVFFLVLSESQTVSQIILVSAAIIGAIRLAAYYRGSLAQDLAKLFPLTMLAVFLLDPGFFSFEKLIRRISEIPNLLNHIIIYLLFIFALEVVMRSLFLVIDFFTSEKEREIEEEVEKKGK